MATSGRSRTGVKRELTLFYGVAALAFVVVSAGAIFASRSVARNQALSESETMASRLAAIVFQPLLAGALNGDEEDRLDLNQAIANRIAEGYLTEVTIWDVDGTVLYSDDVEAIGTKLPPPAEVVAAITRGVTSSAFEDKPEVGPENPDNPGYVEVYIPYNLNNQRTLAFEAYYSYSRVQDAAESLLASIIPLVVVPLIVLQLIQLPIGASLARRVRRHEAERSRLLERALGGSERERIRIAADLHDGPIQDLAGIGYALGAVESAVPEQQRPIMASVQTAIRHAIDSLRMLMVDLYPPDLSASQLPATISGLAAPLRDKEIQVETDIQPLPELGIETVTTLYRVAREGLANVAKHARAKRVDIKLHVHFSETAGSLVTELTIADDGVGIASDRQDRRAEGHLGLALLRDRVHSLGGTMQLSADPSGGTRLTTVLPVGHSEDAVPV